MCIAMTRISMLSVELKVVLHRLRSSRGVTSEANSLDGVDDVDDDLPSVPDTGNTKLMVSRKTVSTYNIIATSTYTKSSTCIYTAKLCAFFIGDFLSTRISI